MKKPMTVSVCKISRGERAVLLSETVVTNIFE